MQRDLDYYQEDYLLEDGLEKMRRVKDDSGDKFRSI